MRSAFFTILSLILTSRIIAQCPEFQLVDLQSLQRSNDVQRENALRSLGFDLGTKTGNSLQYNKCWSANRNGNPVYNQVLYWNIASGNITFLTPDESAFLALRKSIEGRHGQTGTLSASDRYIGQVFQYKFGSRWLNGVMHWSVDISFK
jgi:hypothetical protein